ncbi:ORM1-like protein 2 [Echinococcus granulosus]|nr:ORM1-like protein 2 [Echinococcus granulosus]
MTTLVEALQRKFKALVSDEITPECKLKLTPRAGGAPSICTREIALDHLEITSIGDPKEMIHIFDNVRELDISTNRIRFWSDVFALLECSSNLQSLNLSYNPLQFSTLFCETGEIDEVTVRKAEFPTPSSSFPSDIAINSQHSNSDNVGINLLDEISFCEEERNDLVAHDKQILEAPDLSTSCLSYHLNTLLLNSTRVPWKRVLLLLNYLPNLTTLHAALNDYSCCCARDTQSKSLACFPQLLHLYFSENRLDSWSDVCCLGGHFPRLQHLVLLRNPLQVVPPLLEGKEETPFACLEDLNLMETRLDAWESVDALTQWFPALKSLRLGKDIPLLQGCDAQIFRYDVISRIPTLTSYNITPITEDERERAERDFVRRFGQMDEGQRPKRFWELKSLHGYVAPLVSVNLSPKRKVRLRIQLDDQEKWHSCCLRQSIARLRHEVCSLFGLSAQEARATRLVYFDAGIVAAQGPEEMRHLARLLYTYHPNEGDTLLITRLEGGFPETMQVGTATSTANPTSEYLNSTGTWITYLLLIAGFHLILLCIPFLSVASVWTLTCTLHNVLTYLLLHWEKGSPYETLDQGEARILTQWEQFDDGEQYSPTKKFLLVVPIVIFILASFYTQYDPIHFVINASTLILLSILPKLPQFYRVRVFGINQW